MLSEGGKPCLANRIWRHSPAKFSRTHLLDIVQIRMGKGNRVQFPVPVRFLQGHPADTLEYLSHSLSILSARPKFSHRCVSLNQSPWKPVLILTHATRISTEQTSIRTKRFKHNMFNISLGCTPRGSCNRTLLRRVLQRFSNRKCFLEGFLEGACKGFQ